MLCARRGSPLPSWRSRRTPRAPGPRRGSSTPLRPIQYQPGNLASCCPIQTLPPGPPRYPRASAFHRRRNCRAASWDRPWHHDLMLIHRGAWRLPSVRSTEPSPAPRRPSFADGDRQPHLGYVGDRHLEEIVQDGEGPPVPMGVRYRVVAPTIQGERSVPRWSAFADVDGQRPGWIGSRVARAWVLRYVVLSYLHIVLRHEV